MHCLEGRPPGSTSQPCYPPAEWERLDRWAVDVLESSEKIRRNGAAGGGHSLGTSLEDRARHDGARSSGLSSAKQLVSPVQPGRHLISFSGTSFKKNHILQSCQMAHQYRLCDFSLQSTQISPRSTPSRKTVNTVLPASLCS